MFKLKNIKIHKYLTPSYNSILEVKPENKNYVIFKKIHSVLVNNKKHWIWLMSNSNITENRWNGYISGKDNFSLMSIEKIANVLREFIDSPKELMNENFVILKYGKEYKLNLDLIITKYGITQAEISNNTNIDRGAVSLYARNKAKEINHIDLRDIYIFLKRKGVPLTSILDLIYFESWGEKPDHFISKKAVKGLVFKFGSKVKIDRTNQNTDNYKMN